MQAEGTFGARLRKARLESGMSQSELEIKSGIPKARLSRYENGHVLPSIGTLTRLADALGVSQAALLGDQRAVIEEFAAELFKRGVVIPTAEQARLLAHAVADVARALAVEEQVVEPMERTVAGADGTADLVPPA